MSSRIDIACFNRFCDSLRNVRGLKGASSCKNEFDARLTLFRLGNSIYGSFIEIAYSRDDSLDGIDDASRNAIRSLGQRLRKKLEHVDSWQKLLQKVVSDIGEWLKGADWFDETQAENVRDLVLRKLTRRFSEIVFSTVALGNDVFDEPGPVRTAVMEMIEKFEKWDAEF